VASHSHGAISPESCIRIVPRKTEGAGKAGRRMHPQPRMQKWKAYELVTTGSPEYRPSLRNGFNGLLRARPGDRALLSPSPPRSVSIFGRLISASGYQAHTTSPSAHSMRRLAHGWRPSHPTPNVRDDRETPLWRVRDDDCSIAVSTNLRSGIFLRKGLDRDVAKLPDGQISRDRHVSMQSANRSHGTEANAAG
jgi:hypothetical protein